MLLIFYHIDIINTRFFSSFQQTLLFIILTALPYFTVIWYHNRGDIMILWTVRIIALIFLIWFILPIFKGFKNHGTRLGIAICLFILLFLTNTPLLNLTRSFCLSNPMLTFIWIAGKVALIAFCAYVVSVTLAMVIASLIKPKKNATAIALGIRAEKHGPSTLLKGRINATKRYLDQNPDTVAILSGGKCKKDFMHEAQCMYDELVKMGVNSKQLIIENEALSTYENILFSKRIIDDQNKEKNLAIVSDRFHQLRARLIVRKLGIKSHVGAVNSKTAFLYIPTYFVREWIALPYEALFRFRPHR